MNEIREKIRNHIIESYLFGESSGLTDSTSFLTNAIIDSAGMLELINFIELEFGIALADNELIPQNLDSIDNITNFILNKSSNV